METTNKILIGAVASGILIALLIVAVPPTNTYSGILVDVKYSPSSFLNPTKPILYFEDGTQIKLGIMPPSSFNIGSQYNLVKDFDTGWRIKR